MNARPGICPLLAALLVSAPSPAWTDDITDTVRFADSLIVRSGPDGDVVLLRGTSSDYEQGVPGHPDLPVLRARYIVPPGTRVSSITATPTRSDTLAGPFDPVPIPEADGSSAEPDPLVYESATPYPNETAALALDGAMRGFRIVSIAFHPVQFVGATGALIHHQAFNVTLTLASESQAARARVRERLRPGRRLSRSQTELTWLRANVRNTSQIDGFYPMEPQHYRTGIADTTAFGGFTPTDEPSLDGPPVDYVIICDTALEEAFQTLANWKTEKGVPAVVRTTQWIDDHYTDFDQPERIRAFIIDAYERWGTDWVLLGGDHSTVPARFLWGGEALQQGPGQGPSDVYYAGVDGSWNDWANYKIGENAGVELELADPYYDVWVGRAPVDSEAEATTFVAKVLSYVRAPSVTESGPRDTFYTNFVAYAGLTNSSRWKDEGGPDTALPNGVWKAMHVAQNFLLPNGYEPTLFLEDVWDDAICEDCYGTSRDTMQVLADSSWVHAWHHPSLVDSLNAGANLVYHHEHSNPYGQGGASACFGNGDCANASGSCVSSDCVDSLKAINDANHSIGLRTHDIDALTNDDGAYSVVYGTGSYANATDFRSVSEHWIRNPNGGAVAYVGFKRSSGGNALIYPDTTFYHVLIEDETEKIGQALGNMVALGYNGQGPHVRTATSFNLLGDPEMSVWSAVPDSFDTPSYSPTSVSALGPQTITVTVTSGSAAVADAQVCLKQSDVGYAIATTDASGIATFYDFEVGNTDDILVTATKHNYVPVRDTLDVSDSPDAWVVYASHEYEILDGNANTRIEAGEDVALDVALANGGSATGDSLVARLFVNERFTINVVGHDTDFPFALGASGAPFTGASFDVPAHQLGIRLIGEPSGVGTANGVYVWQEPADSLRWNVSSTALAGSARGTGTDRVPENTIVQLTLDVPDGFPDFHNVQTADFEGDDVVVEASSTTLQITLVNNSTVMTDDTDRVQFVLDESGWIVSSTAADTILAGIGGGSAGTATFGLELSPEIPDGHEVWLSVTAEVDEELVGISDFTLPIRAPVLELRSRSVGSCLGCYAVDPVIHNTGGGDADSLVLRLLSSDPDVNVLVGEVTDDGLAAGAEETITGLKLQAVGGAEIEELSFDLTATTVFDRSTSDTLQVAFEEMDLIPPGAIPDARAYAFAPQSITVRWDTVAVAGDVDTSYVGYNVYRKPVAGSFTRINEAPVSGASLFVDSGLEDGTQYIYRVVAVDEDGNEGDSADAASYTWPAIASGWPKRAANGTESSPLVFNIDNDDTTEVFLAADKIYAWNADGSPYESEDGVFFSTPDTVFLAALAGGDLDADGTYELIAASFDSLYVLEHDGTRRTGFPKYVKSWHAPPTVANIDNDVNDYLEIIAPSADTLLYVWDKDGNTFLSGQSIDGRFAKVKGRFNYGGVSVADLDGNGDLEVVHASGYDGWIEVFAPTDSVGGPDADLLWSHYTGVAASDGRLWKPAIGDITGDGSDDIAVAQGNGGSPSKVIAFEADGTPIDSLAVADFIGSSSASGPPMALADLDDDDDLELLIGQSKYIYSTSPFPPDSLGYGLLLIDVSAGSFDEAVQCSIWVHKPWQKRTSNTGVIGGALVADIDGDSNLEILVGTHDFSLHAFEWEESKDACVPDERMPLLIHNGELWATPQIGDFDDDSKLELLVSDMGGRVVVYDLPGSAGAGSVEWARFGNDIGNTGRYTAGGGSREPANVSSLATHVKQNWPNPFNPRTTIAYDVGVPGKVTIRVYDAGGRRVATLVDRVHAPGSYRVLWDGTDDRGRTLSSGVYFYQLETGSVRDSRKLLLLK